MTVDNYTFMSKKLSSNISLTDFKKKYWLKTELQQFCRTLGLPASVGKTELSKSIEFFLKTGKITTQSKLNRIKIEKMPTRLNSKTQITNGFKLNRNLRDFFISKMGHKFHFNECMRNFIKTKIGHTLEDACTAWNIDQMNPVQKKIKPQFEYNAHIRKFFKENPNSNLNEAIYAWKKLKKDRSK
jgi:SAP domain-containing new25/Domain of unknown function (DUF6434)